MNHKSIQKKESGEPENVRRDEVGRSGVYPMSGPHAFGDVPIRGQMEWGQGERGVAGYYDHGGSELSYEGGQLLGGLTAGPSGAPGPDPGAHERDRLLTFEIPREEWPAFFDSFSRQHEGWLVTVEVIDPDTGWHSLARDCALSGVTAELRQPGKDTVSIVLGKMPTDLSHPISAVTRVWLKKTPEGAAEAIAFESATSSNTILRFRSPVLPETVDDVLLWGQ